MSKPSTAHTCAHIIHSAFDQFQTMFKEITYRAQARFERRDWAGARQDAQTRLDLYKQVVDETVGKVRMILQSQVQMQEIWRNNKTCYSDIASGRNDIELAETFFNSITRRIFTTVGVNPDIEYVDSDFEFSLPHSETSIYRTYLPQNPTGQIIETILRDCQFQAPFVSLSGDARLVARETELYLHEAWGNSNWDRLEILDSIFYRNKGAYIIGRFCKGRQIVPLALALIHPDRGIVVDAVLMHPDEVSIVFSFARSYFRVVAERPRELIHFLKSVMPDKPVAELYISLGYNKHGKTELYRDMWRHLHHSDDQFVIAPGAKGMVMAAFTLPSYPLIFKIIKDRFDFPKKTTRARVMEKYHLVFKHDRVGRLVDAQEFEHLKFKKNRFSPLLLDELLSAAANSVHLEDDYIVIKHLYTERRLIPLNLYLKESPFDYARQAVIDYGNAIKDLAKTNIFPGDLFLKNFGVTRHGRVVFYDYDELALLTECNFRKIPPARYHEDEFSAEPWFHIAEMDVFPEEFATFVGLDGLLRETFFVHHSDLCDVEFWRDMQQRHEAGEFLDVYPYKQRNRLWD